MVIETALNIPPLFYSSCVDIFCWQGDVRSYAQHGIGPATADNILQHGIVSVRCFNKYLRLVISVTLLTLKFLF